MRTLPLVLVACLSAAPVARAQENLLDGFTALLTGGDQDRASELLDVLQSCRVSTESQNLFEDILSQSLNATRTCLKLEASRENADDCIQRASHAMRIATSPYDVFSVQALTDADIAHLSACGEGVGDVQSTILDSFQVLVKRFLQCDAEFTDSQKDAIYDIFGGDDQAQEVSRATMSSVCSSLHFAGSMHKDAVDFLTQTLRHFVVFVPSRRR